VHTDPHVIGNNTTTINFSDPLFLFNGGPAIVFGGAGGEPGRQGNRNNDGIWYESLSYSSTGRPRISLIAKDTLTTKPHEQEVVRLAALTQPEVMDSETEVRGIKWKTSLIIGVNRVRCVSVSSVGKISMSVMTLGLVVNSLPYLHSKFMTVSDRTCSIL
jgi:hypothetical protein